MVYYLTCHTVQPLDTKYINVQMPNRPSFPLDHYRLANTVQHLYNTMNFSKLLKKDTPYLAHEGKVGNPLCEFLIWSIIFNLHSSCTHSTSMILQLSLLHRGFMICWQKMKTLTTFSGWEIQMKIHLFKFSNSFYSASLCLKWLFSIVFTYKNCYVFFPSSVLPNHPSTRPTRVKSQFRWVKD